MCCYPPYKKIRMIGLINLKPGIDLKIYVCRCEAMKAFPIKTAVHIHLQFDPLLFLSELESSSFLSVKN
jgi:hypothetical protein